MQWPFKNTLITVVVIIVVKILLFILNPKHKDSICMQQIPFKSEP